MFSPIIGCTIGIATWAKSKQEGAVLDFSFVWVQTSGESAQTHLVGGPAKNLSNFQIAPIPILSVLTCSTSSPHDILKVLRKIFDHNLPVGRDKPDD